MKQVFSLISGSKKPSDEQVLSIRTGERHFGFSISSATGDELYQLCWYTGEEMSQKILEDIYKNHAELNQAFSKILICYDYPQSVLVPQTHFKQEDAQLMLYSMHGGNGNDNIVTEEVPKWQLKNVYGVPAEVYDWTHAHFQSGTPAHAYTVGLNQVEVTDFEGSLVVDFRTDDFSLIVTRANKLLMAQTFPYSTPADVIYYLLDICRQFSFTQETVRVTISGLVDQQSVLYRELYNYFLHLRFREPLWTIPQNEENYPAHFFTSLNDLARCGS